MAQTTCPTCNGRGAVSNPRTGSPALCPNCEGQTTVSLGAEDLVFWYPINPPQLTALQANVPSSVIIDNDADFIWDRIIASSTGIFSVGLIDRFTSRPLMPDPSGGKINSENIVGTAQLPFWLPKPYLIRRTSAVSASFTDRSGALNTIQFCLVGYKVS
jgi:hypothetical protein